MSTPRERHGLNAVVCESVCVCVCVSWCMLCACGGKIVIAIVKWVVGAWVLSITPFDLRAFLRDCKRKAASIEWADILTPHTYIHTDRRVRDAERHNIGKHHQMLQSSSSFAVRALQGR